MLTQPLTIGRLAREAGVGLETVRYYQRRNLLPVPTPSGAFRHYPSSAIERIRFIKRAQELGFSLDEIAELLQLQDGGDRAQIRHIAGVKIAQIEQKLSDLHRMQKTLQQLVVTCEHTDSAQPCPIIDSFMQR